MRLEEALGDAVRALRPHGFQFLLIGGMAHELLLRQPDAHRVDFEPLSTMDIDLVTPLQSPVQGNDLREALLAGGFHEELTGTSERATARYRWRSSVYYLQLLAPRRGAAAAGISAPLRLGGLAAERLPHLRPLLLRPVEALLETAQQQVPVSIPNPAAFMVQKILISQDRWRSSPKVAGKDLLYIHDTAQAYPPHGDTFRCFADGTWRSLSANERKRVERWASALAGGPSDACREAAEIARSTTRAGPPSARDIAEVCLQVLSGLRSPPGT